MKIKYNLLKIIVLLNTILFQYNTYAWQTQYWHNIERAVRYTPDGEDIIIKNGSKRFNRALYGTHTDFRIEAGDLPEFSVFLPHMGGNIKFGLIKDSKSKWLINADNIEARYIAGRMQYSIKDSLLGNVALTISVIPLADAEGVIIKVDYPQNTDVDLLWVYGGACGKRFSRNGDLGADPESVFYLKKEYCKGDTFEIFNNTFTLDYYDIRSKSQKIVKGLFPVNANAAINNAGSQNDPVTLYQSLPGNFPVITSLINLSDTTGIKYYCIYKPSSINEIKYEQLPDLYLKAEKKRLDLFNRVKLVTPDPFLNTLGGVLVVAADGVWDGKSFMHGAIAWRMPLNGWRGASMADPLGWSDRAQTHFRGYAKAQYLEPDSGPSVPDPKKGLARQQEKQGVSLFTRGYISRNPGKISKPHHYDMNLVFIDQIIRHIDWTGDTAFLREIWPVIERHMEWEKRCFDGNNDGLYDAYCCIWASDALQYSGGGVTHSSAYNYFSNMKVARLAELLGLDSKKYIDEAEKIKAAMMDKLWIGDEGRFAEYIDLLGKQMQHHSAALWTYYHAIDSKVPDNFQAYQMMNNVTDNIPQIPVRAKGLAKNDLYTISTTNWQPYTWSINNVALAETMHTCLAYWQSGQKDVAFKLWKSALIESMYLGSSPGNIQQLSFYDAARGELYRDFADPVAMVTRSLVEGLFGIEPDALNNILKITSGFPEEWDSVSLVLPEISIDYKKSGNTDYYKIKQSFQRDLKIDLEITAKSSVIKGITVNGHSVDPISVENSIDKPKIIVHYEYAPEYEIKITWGEYNIEVINLNHNLVIGSVSHIKTKKADILQVYDPQHILNTYNLSKNKLNIVFANKTGNHTFFVETKQNNLRWWHPVNINLTQPFSFKKGNNNEVIVKNESEKKTSVSYLLNYKLVNDKVKIPGRGEIKLNPDNENIYPGSNIIQLVNNDLNVDFKFINWEVKKDDIECSPVNINSYLNDSITNIFKNKYLSPRCPYPTLQLPVNGIGNWCYNNIKFEVDDSGLRKMAGENDTFNLPVGIPFISNKIGNNVVYTSLWDNYPDNISVNISDTASHIYLIMTGTTNPMQSRFVNGLINVSYTDGTKDTLELKNPENWWPIEQDYYTDGFAFTTDSEKPYRIHLKTGEITRNFNDYTQIKGFSTMAVEGGAATVIDFPVNPGKKIEKLTLNTMANDVVLGVVALTLVK